MLLGQSPQIAFNDTAAASVEHLNNTTLVKIGDDRRELVAAAMVSLIQGQSSCRLRLAPSSKLILGDTAESTLDLVTGGSLATRDLGVRSAPTNPLAKSLTEPPRHPLACWQLRMGLREGATTLVAFIAPLAPSQVRTATRDRQVPYADHRTILDIDRHAPTTRATTRASNSFHLQLQTVADLHHIAHFKSIQTDETANVILHPLFLLAPRSINHAKPRKSSGCLHPPPTPAQ
jgi:hypothetical protein